MHVPYFPCGSTNLLGTKYLIILITLLTLALDNLTISRVIYPHQTTTGNAFHLNIIIEIITELWHKTLMHNEDKR